MSTPAPSQRLGPYELICPIGKGGMGEVWRARDTRLGRDAAIKFSQAQFSDRFQREASTIASLNHPNVCTLYDVGPNYLVMEYVEGADLNGPVPFDRALEIAGQVAAALEAAHEKGIVHRDLKPGNIKVRPDGSVKVLDFGLAKSGAQQEVTPDSPTILSSTGMILGTAGYMSPEQARGQEVDKRADIFAFGVVLYELLTGERLFEGQTITDTLAAVLTREPDLEKVPEKVRRLLRSCLEKDPKRRLRDIADWTTCLYDGVAQAVPPSHSSLHWLLTVAALAVSTAVLGFIAWRATRPVDHPLTRLNVDLGPSAVSGADTTVAISPDGRRIVFPVRGADSKQQLATRLLDQAEATLLPGTDGGSDPFYSPDGQWIGFFAGNQLKKTSVSGGAPVVLCPTLTPRGASWGEDGNIVASAANVTGLVVLSAGGGPPKPLTKLARNEITHRWPQVLPGAQAVLFTAGPSAVGQENAGIEAVSLKTGKVTVLVRGGYYGRYVPGRSAQDGYLLYVHEGALFGMRFNPARLEVSGGPVPLIPDVAADPTNGGGQFDFSESASGAGTLVYLAGKSSAQTMRLAWLGSAGMMQPLAARPGAYQTLRISPDGKKAAFSDGASILVYDTERDTTTRLTSAENAFGPVWTPDGSHIIFRGAGTIYWIRSDGAGGPQQLPNDQDLPLAWSFSPDGGRLAYSTRDSETGFNLWTLPLDLTDPDHPKPGKPEPLLATPADEAAPRFSPDGRWIAYRSNESGTYEIYVRPFPAGNGSEWPISDGGGLFAFWSRNGRELFYETIDGRIMVTEYRVTGDSFAPGKPRLWSDRLGFSPGLANIDLAPDGKRFIVFSNADSLNAPPRIVFLLNFFDELKRRIPPDGR
jgi:serine/threonine-protein kinase